MARKIIIKIMRWLEGLMLGIFTITGSLLIVILANPYLERAMQFMKGLTPILGLGRVLGEAIVATAFAILWFGFCTAFLALWTRMLKARV